MIENRTNLSSPGEHAGSEPVTEALMALVERLQPPLVLDVHSPLELVLPRGEVPRNVAESLSRAADLPIVDDVGGPCPGAFDDWLLDRGTPGILYEVEHAGLPAPVPGTCPGSRHCCAPLRRSRPARPAVARGLVHASGERALSHCGVWSASAYALTTKQASWEDFATRMLRRASPEAPKMVSVPRVSDGVKTTCQSCWTLKEPLGIVAVAVRPPPCL